MVSKAEIRPVHPQLQISMWMFQEIIEVKNLHMSKKKKRKKTDAVMTKIFLRNVSVHKTSSITEENKSVLSFMPTQNSPKISE